MTRSQALAIAQQAWGDQARTYIWPTSKMPDTRRYRVYRYGSRGVQSGSGATWEEACERAGLLGHERKPRPEMTDPDAVVERSESRPAALPALVDQELGPWRRASADLYWQIEDTVGSAGRQTVDERKASTSDVEDVGSTPTGTSLAPTNLRPAAVPAVSPDHTSVVGTVPQPVGSPIQALREPVRLAAIEFCRIGDLALRGRSVPGALMVAGAELRAAVDALLDATEAALQPAGPRLAGVVAPANDTGVSPLPSVSAAPPEAA